MKKNILVLFIFFANMQIFSLELVNLPKKYSFYYDDLANKNILSHNADILEKKYNIKVRIFKYHGEARDGMEDVAKQYFAKITEKDNSRQLLIWISSKRKQGVILITDDLKGKINEEYLGVLQNDVLRSLLGRWYISEARVLGKVLGGIIYLLEKDTINKEQLQKIQQDIIVVDDFFYLLSCKPVFADLINLFNFEPISFFFYFPFIVHFIFVRVIGVRFKMAGFIISNIVWAFFTLFVFYLIFHRINIFFHEYIQFFYMFLGLNVPLFFYLINLYRNEKERTIYNYLCSVTGGFDSKNLFEGKGWEK